MQFVGFEKGCAPSALTIRQGSPLTPPENFVKVKVYAFGVNRADTLQRQGHYPPPPGESDILGLEVAGIVEDVGSQVHQWKVGDKVFGLVAGGGYASEVIVNPTHLMRIPEGMAFSTAAGLAEVFLTAFQCLRTIAHVKPAEKVLIHGGASGVGLAALQLCRHWGVEAAATASSSDKLAMCKENGASVLVNYQEACFASVVGEQWPSGVAMILDMVGGDYLNRNLKVLARDGIIVQLAMLAGRFADTLDMGLLLQKRATIQGTTLRNRDDSYKTTLIEAFSTACLDAFTCNELHVNIDTVYSVEQVGVAHERLENNDTMGKIVVEWN